MVRAEGEHSGGLRWFARKEPVERFVDMVEDGLFDAERRIVREHFSEIGGRILDLGCGAGRTVGPLDRLGFDVVGVDYSEPMIDRARSLFPEVPFQVASATALPFDGETFDYVLFSFNGLDYVEPECQRYEALREIRRVLKPDGLFAFSTHNSWQFPLPDDPFDLRRWAAFVYFWLRNAVGGRLLTHYRIPAREAFALVDDGGVYWTSPEYHINPLLQRRQLEQCGFELLEIVGPPGLATYTASWPYYVAEKYC